MASMAPAADTAQTVPTLVRLAPVAARVLQLGWLALQLGGLAVWIAVTPSLHAHYQTTCPDPLCDPLARPNAESIRLLARLGILVRDHASVIVALDWLLALLWMVLGAVIIRKQPRDPVALLIAYGGLVLGGDVFLDVLRGAYPHFSLPVQAGIFLTRASWPLLIALFPEGRWVPRWSRWVAVGAAGYAAVFAFAGSPPLGLLAVLELPVGLALWGSLVGAQIYRYRHVSTVVQRQQTKWLLFGVGVFVANIALVVSALVPGLAARYQLVILALSYGAITMMALAVGFAILRHHLFDIDLILNRALVYGGLTGGVVGIYALVVGTLGSLLQVRGGFLISLLGAGVVAVLFQPLRDRLQRIVDRLLYGRRNEPYAALSQLGSRLETTPAPEAILPTIVETVRDTLNLPYAAIALSRGEGGGEMRASAEVAKGSITSMPLLYQGTPIGRMMVTPRAGETVLGGADRRLLSDLARHAGIAAHAVRLTEDLQRSREQLVTAREEERRRLRRDLHDGLGPSLATITLQGDTARDLLRAHPDEAEALLGELTRQAQVTMQDVRRLIHELRPPVLDDLGLVAALHALAASLAQGGTEITIEAPPSMPQLPAAVEVAAYRITQEALTNVVKHAHARRCILTLSCDHVLRLRISDDGRGIPADREAGVGLAPMRERAEELGGACGIELGEAGGTVVSIQLPLGGCDGTDPGADR